MKVIKWKKALVLLAALVVVAAAAISAYAYFTSTGTGSTTASVGSASHWTVSADALSGTLYPGQGSDESTGTVTNPGQANQNLAQLNATIEAPTPANGHSGPVACAAADFALSKTSNLSGWVIDDATHAHLVVGQDLSPSGTYHWSGLSVSMVDGNYNQNDCQGATANLQIDAS